MDFNNLKIWLKNLFDRSKENNKNISYDKVKDETEEDDDEKLIPPKKADENPGNVKLNGGSHDTVMGLNRKIISVILAVIFTVVALMFLYNMQDNAGKKVAQQNAIDTTNTAASMKNVSQNIGYDQVFQQREREEKTGLSGANSRFANKKPSDNNSKNENSNTDNNAVSKTNNTPVAATPRNIPQIPSATPVVVSPQNSVESEAEKAENQRKNKLAERYKSAISFNIGNIGNNANVSSKGNDGDKGVKLANTSQSSFPSSPIQYMAASDGVLQAGTLIPAMLFSGINTNVAGQVTAQTMADVYDTATHSNLLIPVGSQLIGSYDASVSEGNNRVNVIFSTIVLPDGSSYAIDGSMVAVDGAGYNGIAGKVDHHTDKALRDGIVNSAFAALSSSMTSRVYLDMSSITNITNMSGIKPTITINPGKEFNLFVTKPIIFAQN